MENVRVNLLGHSKERANNPPLPNACDDAEGGGDGACVRDHRKGIFGTNTLVSIGCIDSMPGEYRSRYMPPDLT